MALNMLVYVSKAMPWINRIPNGMTALMSRRLALGPLGKPRSFPGLFRSTCMRGAPKDLDHLSTMIGPGSGTTLQGRLLAMRSLSFTVVVRVLIFPSLALTLVNIPVRRPFLPLDGPLTIAVSTTVPRLRPFLMLVVSWWSFSCAGL